MKRPHSPFIGASIFVYKIERMALGPASEVRGTSQVVESDRLLLYSWLFHFLLIDMGKSVNLLSPCFPLLSNGGNYLVHRVLVWIHLFSKHLPHISYGAEDIMVTLVVKQEADVKQLNTLLTGVRCGKATAGHCDGESVSVGPQL